MRAMDAVSGPRPVLGEGDVVRPHADPHRGIGEATHGPSSDEARRLTRPLQLGPAVLAESQAGAPRHDRRYAPARGTADQFEVSMPLGNGAGLSALPRRAPGVGDISIIDLASAEAERPAPPAGGDAGRVLSLTLPRAIVAPLLAAPPAPQAAVIARDTPFGRLMREHLLALRRHGPQLSAAEGEAAVRASARLLARGLDRPAGAKTAASPREALLTAIKRHIEQHLSDPARIDAAALCRRFGLSRAKLYRLLAGEGGLARYVQQRRLCHAFGQLVSPDHRHRRIIDIALDSGFGGDASFTRAFRRQFGITPGDVRAQAEAAREGTRPPLDPPETWLEEARRARLAAGR